MTIDKNKMYRNYTKKFLSPVITYDDEIAKMYRRIFKTGIFINPEKKYTIDISINSEIFPENVEKFEEILKKKGLFISKRKGDYYENEILITMKVPPQFEHAYNMFIGGHYSSMYTKEELLQIFPTQSKTEIFLILTKNEMAITHLMDIIAQEFGTDLNYEDAKTFKEYDIPPKTAEEVYNCKKPKSKFLKDTLNV